MIKQLGVVGAGQMGASIALLAAMHDVSKVTVLDVSNKALTKGTNAIASSLQRLIKSGKAPEDALDATMARIHTTTNVQVCWYMLMRDHGSPCVRLHIPRTLPTGFRQRRHGY